MLEVARKIRLDVNADKTKHVAMSREKNAGRSQNIKTDNISFGSNRKEPKLYSGRN
jgi:hypothetical protein